MVLDAAVEVALAAVFPLRVFGRVVDTLAVELEPGEAAVEVGGGGVVGSVELLLQRLHGGIEGVVGGVAERGGVVEGRPGGGLDGSGVGGDDWCRGVRRSGRAVAAEEIEGEDAYDQNDE